MIAEYIYENLCEKFSKDMLGVSQFFYNLINEFYLKTICIGSGILLSLNLKHINKGLSLHKFFFFYFCYVL